MKLFAIADLHLSLGTDKPMDVFGPQWRGHADKLATSWRAKVGPDDVVLLPGDISWAMRLPEAEADFAWLRDLPGEKVIIRGNHDYWWAGVKKLREFAGPGFTFLHNTAYSRGGAAVAGSRLWTYPFIHWPHPRGANPALAGKEPVGGAALGGGRPPVDDEKVRASELDRLRASLRALSPDAALRVCLVHFPPVSAVPEANAITALLAEYRIDLCLYGHVHGLEVAPAAADCTIDGVRCLLVAADYLDFDLKFIKEL